MKKKSFIVFVFSFLLISSCAENYSPEQKKYIAEVEHSRKEKDDYMKNDPNSPFNFKGKVEFHPLKYFEINPNFVFKSKLFEYSD